MKKIRVKKLLDISVLSRYLIKELFLYFGLSFIFFFLVFFVNQILLLAEGILEKHVPAGDVLLIIWYSLPFIIAQAAPFATLVGFLVCLGGMVSQNELLAMRALGVSFGSITLSVIFCGLVISLFSFYVNDYLLPIASRETTKMYTKIVLSNPGVVFESYSVTRTKNSVVVAGEVKDNTVSHLLMFDTDAEGNERIITAGQTKTASAPTSSVMLQLQMQDALIVSLNTKDTDTFDVIETAQTDLNVFNTDFPELGGGEVLPRELTAIDLGKRINEMKSDPSIAQSVLNSWELEFNKKFSLPFGSIFFAFFAVPLALTFGKHHGQTIGLILGIGVSVLYWAMIIMGQVFGFQNGFSGFWAMWIPNIFILVVGLVFYLRLIRT